VSKLSLCVYCGSRLGSEPAFQQAAEQVGILLGQSGYRLVYGGGNAGLMGTVANAALKSGAQVVGVIPRTLVDRELAHPGLTELHVVDTMHQRKTLMAEHADAFLALPGGIGTFEELFEVWTWRQLGYHDKPVALLNTAGYYDRLLAFLDQSVDHGFVQKSQRDLLQVSADATELLPRLARLSAKATAPDNYRAI
jgi:uncharacterized protein (TIGR00730 family)